MNLPQTKRRNAADNIRENLEILDSIRKKTIKLFGPPGTGKTHTLLNIVEKGIHIKHMVPDYIAFCSYTRKAAREGMERVLKKFKGTFREDSFTLFKTIHSLCLARTRDAGIEVIDENKHIPAFSYLERGETVKLETGKDEDGKIVIKNYPIQLYEKARNCKITLKEAYDADTSNGKTRNWSNLVDIVNNWIKFKEGFFMDYTDMIEDFLLADYSFETDYFIVDEAQDLTPLQWDFVYLMASKAKKVYIAGDDDQAIHEWNGASVNEFLNFPGRPVVLKNSRRLPTTVLNFAKNIIKNVKTRKEKDFVSTGIEGYVNTNNFQLKHIEFNKHPKDTWMVLTRTKNELYEVREVAKELGLHFKNAANLGAVNSTHWKCIEIWNKLINDQYIDREAVTFIYKYIKNIEHGWRTSTSKKWKSIKETYFNYALLNERCGLLQEKGPWTTAMDIKVSDKNYIEKLLEKGVDSQSKPLIIIDKIHQVKGGEADHVVIYEACPKICTLKDKAQKDRDAELRVWYVGVTRAKKGLNIIKFNKPYGHYMPLAALGYGNYRI